MPPLKRISIAGYRAARELNFEPRSVCALVGEASSGKSTVLTGIWTLLEAAAPPPTIDDVSHGTSGRIHLEADVERGRSIFLDANPPATLNLNRAGAPPVLFFPANLRSRTLLAPVTGAGADVAHLFEAPVPEHHWSAADGGLQLVMGMERVLASNLRRFVLLVEEPELYLSPYAQRHLFRLLRELAKHGNQILYSTHAPVFLSVDRMEELALVRHHPVRGTALFQPAALAESEAFRVLSEFDSDRAELFLARAALLVEGRTEKLAFPLVFEALGIQPDKEGIVVLECGGKGNIPLFARVCNACDIPYVVVHDRDAPKGERPVDSERVVNQQILDEAGRRRTVVLTPDFEVVSGVSSRGRARKPRRAYKHYTGNGSVPEPLRVAVEKVVKAARQGK